MPHPRHGIGAWYSDGVHWVTKWILWALFKLITGCEVIGWQHVPKQGGGIMVCNHASHLDPAAAGAHAPRLMSYFAKQELMENWKWRWWYLACRVIPVARASRASLLALREAIHRIQHGEMLLVFPEGTRSPDGALQEPKPGVGLLLYETRVPVVACYVEGSNQVLPREAKMIRPNKIRIYYGRPVQIDVTRPPGRPMGEHLQYLADRVMDEVRKLQQQAKGA